MAIPWENAICRSDRMIQKTEIRRAAQLIGLRIDLKVARLILRL